MTADTSTATLADQVVEAFLAGDADRMAALYRPDALVDLVVPTWRWQLVGRDTIRESLADDEFLPGRRVSWWKTTPTADGVLLELESWAPVEGEERKWLALHQFRFVDGAVAEHVVYCSGIWDAATIARQAVEAPLVRTR